MTRRGLTITVWTTVLVLVAIAAAIALQQTSTNNQDRSSTPTEIPSTTAPPTATDSPSPVPTARPTTSEPAPRSSWHRTARSFGTAYTNTAGGRDAWLTRLKQHISPGLAEGFAYTDLAVIPTGQLAGIDKLDETPGQGVRARLTYNSDTAIDITIATDTAGDWVITTIIPAKNDGAAA